MRTPLRYALTRALTRARAGGEARPITPLPSIEGLAACDGPGFAPLPAITGVMGGHHNCDRVGVRVGAKFRNLIKWAITGHHRV